MKKVIAYVHTHWDREWYREFEEFRLRLIEVFDEILEELETNALPCFYFDGQTAALEDYLEIYPQNIERVKKLIAQKKLRIGPFYCSTDSFLVSGESFCRNLEIGMKKSRELGETEFIGYLPDIFGHSKAAAQILKSLKINKACLWRGLGDLPADLDWCGINTAYLIQGYFQDFLNSSLPIEKKAVLLKKHLDKIALKSSSTLLLPIGADHLSTAKNLPKQIDELNKIYKDDYEIKLASPFEYFSEVKKRKYVCGEFLDNKHNFILQGVYSSRIYLKQANAESQQMLTRMAEPLQALAHFYFGSKNRQNEIDHAYKLLIKNHAHDSIYGCGIDEVYKQVTDRFQRVKTISNGIIKRVQRDLSSENGSLSVINLSNFKYGGHIKITTHKKLPEWMNAVKISSAKGFTDEKLYNINDIPITEDITEICTYMLDVQNIEPFSITNITKDNICRQNFLKCEKNSIENKYIKVEIKNNKIILTDKIKNENYFDFIKFQDNADIGDSYNFGALKNDVPIYAVLTKYRIKKFNKQNAVLNVIYEISVPLYSDKKGRSKKTGRHILSLDIILYNQSEYAEFKLHWKNKSKNHILRINFNLKQKIYSTINEDLFGTIERKFNPDYDIYDAIPAKSGQELKTNISPMQRFMSAGDFALFTKGNCGYEIQGNTVMLTLLRAAGIISNPQNPSRGTPAGPPLLTPDLQCLGETCANFAIAFAGDDKEKLFRLAEEFYEPYTCIFTNIKDEKFFQISNENILVYAISLCENGLGLRLYNNSSQEQKTYLNSDGNELILCAGEIKSVEYHKKV